MQIQQIGEKCDLLADRIHAMTQEICEKLDMCKKSATGMQSANREQRSMLAEINLAVGRAERKLQKSTGTLENQMI